MPLVAVTTACIMSAAAMYAVPPAIIQTLLEVEGGRPGMESRNSNGSFDLGPMQINTIHVADFARMYGRPQAEMRALLRDDGCFNVHAGTWMLVREIRRADGDFWAGVGHYHSRTPRHKTRYLGKVVEKARRLFGPQVFERARREDAAAPGGR